MRGDVAFYDRAVDDLRIIMDPAEAKEFLTSLGDKVVALDFETTGLDPRYAKVRLSCIYHPDCGAVILDHMFCGTFNSIAMYMLGPIWAVYNAKFEVRWFDHATKGPHVSLIDVDFLAKTKRGGGHSSLKIMVKRDLGIELDKEEQLSDWGKERLSTSQLQYAAMDGVVTYKLYEFWIKQLTAEQKEAAFTMQDAVRATVECEETGMVLDTVVHQANIDKWVMKRELMLKTLRRFTNTNLIPNLNSNKQISDFLKTQLGKETLDAWPATEKTKQLSLDRKLISPIAAKSPYPFSRWLNALIRFRYYNKYLSTYGETLLTKQFLEDKITYRLNIAQAVTIRYSSSAINIQNIPRAPWVRKAFLPPYEYDCFVIADYSGIELRVLAELSGDKVLRRDVIYGNVHASSASAIFDIPEQDFLAVINNDSDPLYPKYSELRSKGKGFSFQLAYGAQAAALAVVLKCSVEDAEDALRKWAERYPKAYNYRHIIFSAMQHKGYLPVVDGRTIYVPKADRTMPVASNYGIQSAAAAVMLRAMYHVHALRNQHTQRRYVGICATCHDEVLLGVKYGHEDVAKLVLEEGMKLGWTDVFPNTTTDNLIEATSGPNWASK